MYSQTEARPDADPKTAIDAAHAALDEAGDDPRLRMAFYGQIVAVELFLLLDAEPEGERVQPLVLETDAGRVVLAFDRRERMAAFLDAPRDYVALAGRSLVKMIAGRGIGIALNPDVAPSASVIGPEAVDWLAGTFTSVEAQAARIVRVRPPVGIPASLVAALEARLGAYAGRIRESYLAAAEYDDGSAGFVLALSGVPSAAEAAVAGAVDEAVRFSGAEGVRLDVAFGEGVLLERLARVGLAFRPERPETAAPQPEQRPPRPPRLR